MALVSECVIVQRNEHLVALVYPDMEEAQNMNLTENELVEVMEQNRQQLNAQLPPFSKIATVELRKEEFEKTPKKSIKRYLYK